jgi:hypothetical protein
MSTCAAALTSFGSDRWNAEVYGSLSVASQISSMVKSRAQVLTLAYHLRRLNSRLKTFFRETDEVMEGKRKLNGDTESEPVTRERIEQSLQTISRLHETLNGIYDQARKQRLTNNSLVAGPLNTLRSYAEEMLDLADWIEVACQSEDVESIFERAHQEKQRGEVIYLAQVK